MFILVLTTFCLFEDSKFTSASSLQRNQSNLINNNPKKEKRKKEFYATSQYLLFYIKILC